MLVITILNLYANYSHLTAYALYIFVSIFGLLLAAQFWLLVNVNLKLSVARRHVSFIGIGAIAGGILGGYIAGIFSSFFQTEYIPFLAILFILPIPSLIKRFQIAAEDQQVFTNPKQQKLNPLALIRQIKHLRLLTFMVFFGVISSKFIDYLFGVFAVNHFLSEEHLTQFYGISFSSFNLLSLFIQLVVTNKILGRIGVGLSLLILPVLVLINSFVLILIPALASIFIIKLVDGSFKQSLHKSAIELILMPIPKGIKVSTKTFLDFLVDNIAAGAAGILLFFIIKIGSVSNFVVIGLLIFFSLSWLITANLLRKEYKNTFRKALKISKDKNLGKSITEEFHSVLEGGDTQQLKKMISLLENAPLHSFEDDLEHLLNSNNPEIVLATLQLLTKFPANLSERIKSLLNREQIEIKIATYCYLFSRFNNQSLPYINSQIEQKDVSLKFAAVAAYTKVFSKNSGILKLLRLEELFDTYLAPSETSNENITICLLDAIIYSNSKKYYPNIINLFNSPSIRLREKALECAGKSQSHKFFESLLNYYKLNPNEDHVAKSLSKFGIYKILSEIEQAKKNDDLNFLILSINILKHIKTQLSLDSLLNLSKYENIKIKLKAIEGINNLKNEYPLLVISDKEINRVLSEETLELYNLSQLITINLSQLPLSPNKRSILDKLILEAQKLIDTNLGIIFNALDIKYPFDDYLELFGHIKSTNEDLRANAIAYMQEGLDFELKGRLLPIIEYCFTEDIKGKNEVNLNELKVFLCNHPHDKIRELGISFYDWNN